MTSKRSERTTETKVVSADEYKKAAAGDEEGRHFDANALGTGVGFAPDLIPAGTTSENAHERPAVQLKGAAHRIHEPGSGNAEPAKDAETAPAAAGGAEADRVADEQAATGARTRRSEK